MFVGVPVVTVAVLVYDLVLVVVLIAVIEKINL